MFKVRIFRAWEERVLHHAARETAHHTPSWGKAHIFGNFLLSVKHKMILPSLVAHCASPHHISAATASCATGPWPTHKAQTKCTWAPSAGFHSCATNTAMLQGCCTLQTEQRVLSTHGRHPVWPEAETSVQSRSLFQNSLNQIKATCLRKVNVHFPLLWWPNTLHKKLTYNSGTHCSKQQCRQGCQCLPHLLLMDPA